MKKSRSCITAITCAVMASLLVLAVIPSAEATMIPISGSIGFGALDVSVNSPNLATATSFTVSSVFPDAVTGTYSTVPELTTPVTFYGFQFNPAVASVTPLWTFTYDSITYSFAATTVTSFFNAGLDQWDIGGDGTASVSGYEDTSATWNLNLSQSGDSFVFDSSAAAIPTTDDCSTLILLGSAATGLVVVPRRKS